MADRALSTPLDDSFERYLQDKGKGRGGDGGNYRRNAARELERFAEWAAGDRGGWPGIVTDDEDRVPTFSDLDERVFREYARHLAGDRGLKQNTVQTYYRYISAWCGWCVNEGYLEAHYAQRASAMAPLPEDDGRKPGDQQAWTSEQRHALTRYVDEHAREAIETYTSIKFILLYQILGARVPQIRCLNLYRKKQQWDTASLPQPVSQPLKAYRKLLVPRSERWPVFPTFSPRTWGNYSAKSSQTEV